MTMTQYHQHVHVNPNGDAMKGSGLGIGALACGILALPLSCCCQPLAVLLAVAGLGLGIFGMIGARRGKGMAITGMILSIIALLIAAAFFGFSIWLQSPANQEKFFGWVEEQFGDEFGQFFDDMKEEINRERERQGLPPIDWDDPDPQETPPADQGESGQQQEQQQQNQGQPAPFQKP